MNAPSKALHTCFVFCLSVLLSLSLMACPKPTTNPDGNTTPDGGTQQDATPTDTTTQPLTCEGGTLCVKVNNQDVRSCDILLKNDKAIANPQVNFGEETIGEFKFRDSRLALSFIMKQDKTTDQYAVLVKLPDGIGKLEISSVTCSDRKGAKIEKPDVKIDKP